ncbi:extracellular solute-binding protein [Caldilinea sp.]|uniref:extracellular solute-binding protein n=1 Tax=Caldilinea sp. TaxID=2293560 RepID=UPI00257D757F|nr:extracellular solute-binding protein [Caldilinea sp.]
MNVLLKLRRMAALTLVLIMFGAGHQMSAEMPAVLNWNTSFTSFVEVNVSPTRIEVTADIFGLPLAEDEIARQYDKPSVLLQEGGQVHFQVTIPVEGVYTIAFDVAADTVSVSAPEGELRIDGDLPVNDLRRIIFPVFYRNIADTFPKDRYGNDALIRQERMVHWTKTPARDINFSQPYPLRIPFHAGEYSFDFTLRQGTVHLGSIYIETFTPHPSYAEYRTTQPNLTVSDFLLTLEAEFPSYKNDTSVRPSSSRSLTVTPYDTYRLLLNTLGGESWIKSGSAVFYEFEVPEDGLYSITLRALQDTRSNFTVFRRFTINGETPFAELNAFPFSYSTDWMDVPLGDGAPFQVFLRKGRNVLGIEATNSPYLPAIETVQRALLDINTLALEIRKLTGNQRNPFKEWVISDYIPDIRERLVAIAEELLADQERLVAILQSGSSPEILTYQMAIDNLLFLAEDPDRIPTHLGRFSEGPGSAAQLLGSLLPMLQEQPLAIDKIYIHSPDVTPPTPAASFGLALTEGMKRFFYSFRPDPYESIGAGEGELEVWVNRPRQYVDLLQLMADESFTPRTGIRVKFSIMPDESKLVLANAAGIQPDVALGISTHIPYDLAVRNALYDLRSFDDFDSFIRIYTPGALLSYIIDDSVYAIPETQDFWITFYRKDILDAFGLPVPRTWNKVIEILPELQRYGMNYSSPLSGDAGIRWYFATAPYLFNFGAKLYSDDGFASGLGSEEALAAIKFMAESFTIYGMPLTTASFYESFRYGLLPVGVSNIETYVKLMTAAPELEGLWGVDLYPATVLPDGTQNRYATGSAQASIMFKNTDKAQEGWEFLKWWMSTETQIDFQERLLLNYGREYLWNSANLEAFAALPIPWEHRRVILEQWQWLQEPVRLPGSYMQERELGNAWNRIVFDGVNPRVAIDRAILVTNREITRKMEEFGYLRNGERVRKPKIPTIETVKGWMNDAT